MLSFQIIELRYQSSGETESKLSTRNLDMYKDGVAQCITNARGNANIAKDPWLLWRPLRFTAKARLVSIEIEHLFLSTFFETLLTWSEFCKIPQTLSIFPSRLNVWKWKQSFSKIAGALLPYFQTLGLGVDLWRLDRYPLLSSYASAT